jgi:hypothetical protein
MFVLSVFCLIFGIIHQQLQYCSAMADADVAIKNQAIQRSTENLKDGQLGPHQILEITIYPILSVNK